MTSSLDELAPLAWMQLWQVTIAALVIGTVVRLCCRARPRVAYALWMLVVVKSIVPPIWSSPTGLFSWALLGDVPPRRDVASEQPGPLMTPWVADSTPEAPGLAASGPELGAAPNGTMKWAEFQLALLSIWFGGIVLGAAILLGKLIACMTLIRQSIVPANARHISSLADLSRRLGVRREVRLLVTSRPVGPAVWGTFRPSILLPGPLLSGMPPERVDLILAHELIHVRRGDVFVGKLQILAQLIWWFHPLIWWANREAGLERERCCDEEVVSGVGCKPLQYARTLLSVLERKGQLRSLIAIPGVRALEVTSRRLETIMRNLHTDQRRASRISRLVFAGGLVLLVPGTGLSVGPRPQTGPDTAVTVTKAPLKAVRTLSGFIREKATRRPVAGARVSVGAVNDQASGSSSSATTDQAGYYTITDLPAARKYTLVASPQAGDPFFITSQKVEAKDDESPLTADVEFVRGIPFRVRIVDRETGKPIKGSLSYFPISPNNPFKRGVTGYAALAAKDGASVGAFYEADPNDEGQFLGAVLPGPGYLGFSYPFRPGDESRADRKPTLSFPDGKQNIKLNPASAGGPFASVPSHVEPLRWTIVPLGQYDAVIVIDPREGAEVVTYEIRIAPDKGRE